MKSIDVVVDIVAEGFIFGLCFSNSLLNTNNKVYGDCNCNCECDCEPVSLFNNCKVFRELTYFMGQQSLNGIECCPWLGSVFVFGS